MDDLDALDLATAEFQRRVDLVTDDDLARATPCDEWDVGYLIAHVVGGNRFAARVLDGESSSVAIGRIMSTPQLGARPSDDVSQSTEEQRLRFRRPGILEHEIDHPVGTVTAARFLRFRVFDCTLHAWDLAAALGTDTSLDPQLVVAVLAIARAEPPGMGFGIAARPVDGSADPQEHLLALSGRSWPGDTTVQPGQSIRSD
jgi:uncharacterized protein (TIGR03086 family)